MDAENPPVDQPTESPEPQASGSPVAENTAPPEDGGEANDTAVAGGGAPAGEAPEEAAPAEGEDGAGAEGEGAEAAQQEEARDFSQDGSKYRSVFGFI